MLSSMGVTRSLEKIRSHENKPSLINRRNPTNANVQKCKAQRELTNTKKNNKNTFKAKSKSEDRQSQIAWQTVNEGNRRKSTLRAKLKVASQEERIQKWKEHFKNLLGNSTKVTDKPIT